MGNPGCMRDYYGEVAVVLGEPQKGHRCCSAAPCPLSGDHATVCGQEQGKGSGLGSHPWVKTLTNPVPAGSRVDQVHQPGEEEGEGGETFLL